MAAFARVARRAEHPPAAPNVFLCRYAAAEEDNWARIGRDCWRAAQAESGRGSGAFGRRIKRMDDQKMGARDAIGDANGAPTKHRAGAMISTQPVANAG